MNLKKGLAAFCCAAIWLFVLSIGPSQNETNSIYNKKKIAHSTRPSVSGKKQGNSPAIVSKKAAASGRAHLAHKPRPAAVRSETKKVKQTAHRTARHKTFLKKPAAAVLPYNREFRMSESIGNRSKSRRTTPAAAGPGGSKIVTAFEKVIISGKTWYHVTYSKNKTIWLSSAAVSDYLPANGAAGPLNVPLIAQKPQLPRGCEVTSLAMLLKYAGSDVDKMALARRIKKVPFRNNGYYGNPHDGFVGNMYTFSKPGFGVFHEPVAALARHYLGGRIVDLSGKGFDEVQAQIKKKRPVWVIVTSQYRHLPDVDWKTWRTARGPVRISYHEHAVLITGCSDQYVYFNDPLAVVKNRKVNKKDFIAGFNQFGKQAISYN